MNNIEWKDGAVCYANGKQWFIWEDDRGTFICEKNEKIRCLSALVNDSDFKLNEPLTGDYLPKSELDTKQEYNDAVEVFGLFGFKQHKESAGYLGMVINWCGVEIYEGKVCNTNATNGRKLTYSQIIAIGKLKRMMLEREHANSTEIPNSSDQVKNPSHYQLIDGVESIEVIARSMTQEQFKGYCLGNTLKYRLRAGKKDALQQDIDKANFYGELYEMHKEKCYG